MSNVESAVAAYRADLAPHRVTDCYTVAYRGSRNPKNEPLLYDPKDYPKVMVVMRLVFDGETQEQQRVIFADK